MWGAIIKAIDHSMGRLQKGMSSGIDVAKSQGGGAAGLNAVGGGGDDAGSSIAQASKESEENAKDTSNIDIGDNVTSTGEESGGSSGGSSSPLGGGLGGGALGNIGSGAIGGAGGVGSIAGGVGGGDGDEGGEGMESMAEGAGEMLSDKNAKNAKSVSSGSSEGGKSGSGKESNWQKFKNFMGKDSTQTALNYSANLGKGIANAGAIATGNKAAYDLDNSVWNNIGKEGQSDGTADKSKTGGTK